MSSRGRQKEMGGEEGYLVADLSHAIREHLKRLHHVLKGLVMLSNEGALVCECLAEAVCVCWVHAGQNVRSTFVCEWTQVQNIHQEADNR